MIGVAVSTTGERADLLAQAWPAWEAANPDVLRIIEDREKVGVPYAKNRSIAALMDAGVEHLFLADDDVWPTVTDPFSPYVADALPHLMWCWGRKRRLSRNERYTTWNHPRGVMLYVHRSVVERVGGMRTEFGRGGSEHVEWSRRIHQAGFTPSPYIDLTISPTLWHAEDMGRPGESMAALSARRRASTTVKRESWEKRRALMDRFDGDTDFVDYR